MNKTPLNLIADFKAHPDRSDDLGRILGGMIEPTRAEEGCVNYDLHRRADDPTRFVLYEGWESQAALDAHMATPHFQKMLVDLAGVVAERDGHGRPFRATSLTMLSERA